MKTKLSVHSLTVAGTAALVLALSACSGGGDDNSEELDAWAKEVCSQLQPQIERIQTASAAITEASEGDKSPEEVQKADSEAFGEISDAYAALATAVKRAGAPPVDDGPRLRRDAVNELNGLSESYGQLQETVDELDTSDRAEFAEGLSGVADELSKLGEDGNDALKELEEGELGQAMAQQRGCQSPSADPGSSESGDGGDEGGDGGGNGDGGGKGDDGDDGGEDDASDASPSASDRSGDDA